MASNLLDNMRQPLKSSDEEKLRILCTKCNIWDHFKMSREQFHSVSEHKQMKMLHRFYNDLEPVYFAQNRTLTDSSINENIKNILQKWQWPRSLKTAEAGQRLKFQLTKTMRKKQAKLFGLTTDISVFRLVNLPLKKLTYLKIRFFILIRPIYHIKMARKFIIVIFLLLDKSFSFYINQKILMILF